MEGPRAPTTNEFDELIHFLNFNLRKNSQWSVAEEYPTALTPQNIHNFRIIKENEMILSHALTRPLMVKTRRGLIKVGCIGSVVTSEEFRHKGLSASVIQETMANVKAQGCDIAILWTDLFDFYRKFGFELAGSEISLIIDKPLVVPANQYRIVEGNKVDPSALARVYNQHTVCSVRNNEEFNQYLKIPNSRLYTAWGANGALEAYAVEGKGADLQGYIHEWGGNVEALVALFNHVRQKLYLPVTVICPAHSTNLISRLEGLGVSRVNGYLGMIALANPENLFNKIVKSARNDWGISDFILEKRGNEYFYGVGSKLFKTDSESDIIRIIFGPQKPSQLHDAGPEINAILDKVFPMEFWMWGWDSV